MTYNSQTFDVDIELGLTADTGQVFARFQSIDPNTSLPPDVLTGFLPPEDGTGRGMGRVNYTIQARPGLPTGTQIHCVADINFDQSGVITTDQVDDEDPTKGINPAKQALITIDSDAPTSSATLPGSGTATVAVADASAVLS